MNTTDLAETSTPRGLGIQATAERLKNYLYFSRSSIRLLAGWFLAAKPYEWKYRLAYHLYDCSEHVEWLLQRLEEMRGGRTAASVRPRFAHWISEVLHAPDEGSFLAGYYGIAVRAAVESASRDMALLDPAANANEIRFLRGYAEDLRRQLEWFESLNVETSGKPWPEYLACLLAEAGGFHGDQTIAHSGLARPHAGFFDRPKTILFDERIRMEPLVSYEDRSQMPAREATIEQFKVFFNEFYAAALLASVLYDAAEADLPWGFFRDFSRHFWDEARHSEFGAVRLLELGARPDRCNPVLFEQTEALPVLHRIAYLTRGLEAYFMPRKPKRFKEYEENGDLRSQLFADHDWSDEINHVRYGSRWTDYLLENDHREIDDILDGVKAHLTKVRGVPVTDISAPF